MFDTPTTMDNVGKRAQAVYDANIRHLVEHTHHGKFIAVEPDSGDYVVHNQIVGAMLNMRQLDGLTGPPSSSVSGTKQLSSRERNDHRENQPDRAANCANHCIKPDQTAVHSIQSHR